MRRKIAAGNWKMNTSKADAIELVKGIQQGVENTASHHDVIFFPPFTHIQNISEITTGNFYTGAQNCSQFDKGAYTGEISTDMLKVIGCKHVIIGHSERRSIFGESHDVLREKTNTVLKNGMTVVFCIGETLEEREAENQYKVVEKQLVDSLFQVEKKDFDHVIIAYEPVWAIGTGKTATPEQAQDMHAYIRALLKEYKGETVAMHTSILYGGSVSATNAKELFSQPDIDGGLVGGASLKVDDFVTIIKSLPS